MSCTGSQPDFQKESDLDQTRAQSKLYKLAYEYIQSIIYDSYIQLE